MILDFYGHDPAQSPDFARIISQPHFDRLCRYLQDGQVISGGQTHASDRYIAPTLLDQVSLTSAVMQEEIFGPILPIIPYQTLEEAISLVNQYPKPLALYLFTTNAQHQAQVLQSISAGGVCINDTIMHIALSELPFGGIGASGMGRYHGKASFDTFSHYKSVLQRGLWLDFPWRYPPYPNKLPIIKKLMGWG